MKIINAIVAVGFNGEVGLNGKLPWANEPPYIWSDDLTWFREMTMGGILICGHNTFKTLPKLEGRTVIKDNSDICPAEFLANIRSDLPIWIIGGAKTYERYQHLINRWHVSKIEYSGEADTFFNFNVIGKSNV